MICTFACVVSNAAPPGPAVPSALVTELAEVARSVSHPAPPNLLGGSVNGGNPTERNGIGAIEWGSAAAPPSSATSSRRCPAPPQPANSARDRRALLQFLMDRPAAAACAHVNGPPGNGASADTLPRGVKRHADDDPVSRASSSSGGAAAQKHRVDAMRSCAATSCTAPTSAEARRGGENNSENAGDADSAVHASGCIDPTCGQQVGPLLGTCDAAMGRHAAASPSASASARRLIGEESNSGDAGVAEPGAHAYVASDAIRGRQPALPPGGHRHTGWRLRGKQPPPRRIPPLPD